MRDGWGGLGAKCTVFSWGLWALVICLLFVYHYIPISPSSSLSFGSAPRPPPDTSSSKTGPGLSGTGEGEGKDDSEGEWEAGESAAEGDVDEKMDHPAPTECINKTVVIYVYLEKNQLYKDNLQFFLDVGVQERDDTDFVFVLQGNCTIKVPYLTYLTVSIVGS
jgi:hypothetical protein